MPATGLSKATYTNARVDPMADPTVRPVDDVRDADAEGVYPRCHER